MIGKRTTKRSAIYNHEKLDTNCDYATKKFVEERIDGAGDVFLIPFLDGHLFYNPLANVSMLLDTFASSAILKFFRKEILLPKEQSLIDDLSEKGVFEVPDLEQATSVDTNTKWEPTSVTFSNTQKCSLRCKYCYAEGGRLDDLDIPWPVAKAAIDLIIKNAKTKELNPSIRFLGEGEATAGWNGLQRIIEYFKEQCRLNHFTPNISLSTNGVFSRSRLDFIAENCNHLTISLDGVKKVHDSNRVFPNGKGSFDQIIDTIKELEARGSNYNIRSTVSAEGSSMLTEFVQFVGENLQCKSIHVEPVFDATGVTNIKGKIDHIDAQTFVDNFREARRIAAGFRIELYYSGAAMKRRQTFCGASYATNFLVTSRGIVTSCNEVLQPTDIRAEVFQYGEWNQELGDFFLDKETIDRLGKLNVHELPKCKGCIAKYNCGGGCYAKSASLNGDPAFEGYSKTCYITRELLKDNLIFRLISNKLGIQDNPDSEGTHCPL